MFTCVHVYWENKILFSTKESEFSSQSKHKYQYLSNNWFLTSLYFGHEKENDKSLQFYHNHTEDSLLYDEGECVRCLSNYVILYLLYMCK